MRLFDRRKRRMNILDLETPIEIIKAGIIGGDALLATPWGDTRLAKKAVNIVKKEDI